MDNGQKTQRHQQFGISNFDSTKCYKALFCEFGLVFDSHFNGSLLLINDEPEMDTHMHARKMSLSIVVYSMFGKCWSLFVCVAIGKWEIDIHKKSNDCEVSFVFSGFI